MRASVRELLQAGFAMLPSAGLSKGPCVPWKEFQTRLPALDELRRWEQKFKPARWGFVTGKISGRIVIDFDGNAGIELMNNWGLKPHIRTGSGGYHCHLVHPGWRVPTMNAKSARASWPWPGVDIRGDGGFAVLLGRNANGAYVQLRELAPDPFESLPGEVRSFLWNHSSSRRETSNRGPIPLQQADPDDQVDAGRLVHHALDVAGRDGRNNAGFWLACQLRDNGYNRAEAESALRCYLVRVSTTNAKGQHELYTEREILASLSQAYSAPAREPWARRSLPQGNPASGKQRHEQALRETVHSTPSDHDHNADGPDSLGIYVGHPCVPLVGHRGDPLPRAVYSRIPSEVLADRQLKHVDLRVYAVLAAACWQGATASVGKRLIAKFAPCAERLVSPSLRRLETAGHIRRIPGKRGQRGMYHLTSPVFGQKQRGGVHEIIMKPDGRTRLVSVRKDPDVAQTARR